MPGQISGPVWRGRPLPPKPRPPVDWFAIPADVFEANKAIEEKRHPRMGFLPGSNLGRLLMNPRVKRPLRRAIISAVQAPDTRRRTKLQRRIQRQLAEAGV